MEEILLTDKSFFKDEEEHPYSGMFYNGVAYLTRVECDENNGCPEQLLLGYPTATEISKHPRKEEAIREWCGLYDNDPLTNYHIALKYGKIGKSGLTVDELNLLDSIAHKSKIDWFVTTMEGNFKDGETGRKISPRKAVKDLIDGVDVDREWFEALTDDEKYLLVRAMYKLM